MPQKQISSKKRRTRTYAKNRAATAATRRQSVEADSTYFLKLVIVVILGTLWIKLAQPVSWHGVPFGGFPIGAVIGFAGIHILEKDQYNRKIWFAVLLVVSIICYFVPAGIVI